MERSQSIAGWATWPTNRAATSHTDPWYYLDIQRSLPIGYLNKQTNKQSNIKYGYWLQKTNVAKNVSYLAICINIIKRIFLGGEGGRRRLSPLKTGNFSRSSLGVNQKRINFNSRVCGKGTIMCRILHFPALDSRLIFTFEKIGELRGRMTALLRMARLRMGIQNGVENCKPLVSFFLLPLNRQSK